MSEEVENTEEEGAEVEEGLKVKKFSGKKMILIIVPVFLILIGVGGYFMLGGDDKAVAAAEGDESQAEGGHGDEHALEAPKKELLFFDMEPIVVNLNTASGANKFMKISITLEVDNQGSVDDLTTKIPRVRDRFLTFLREMRLEDINGAAGSFRLKEELLSRVNEAVYPTRVNDVLLQQIQVTG